MPKRVTIREVANPVEGAMMVDLLDQEGIAASIPGNEHNAMMGGLLASALRVPLQVPEEDAERAREILSALDEYDEIDPLDAPPSAPDLSGGGDGPYRGGPTEDGPPARKPLVAIAAALVLPMVLAAFGAGHFYARSYPRGFALLAAGWVCVWLTFSGERLALLGIPTVIVLDMVGALAAIKQRDS